MMILVSDSEGMVEFPLSVQGHDLEVFAVGRFVVVALDHDLEEPEEDLENFA